MRDDETVEALLAIAAGDRVRGLELTTAAADRNGSRLAIALRDHLEGESTGGVYDQPAAFDEFISGAGNVELYERLIAAVGAVHRSTAPVVVADIGCGDGRVTAGTITDSTTSIDLVEPSAALLTAAKRRLVGRSVEVGAHQLTVARFLEARATARWDLVQSTFALHSLPPAERSPVLTELAARTDHLVLAEFDVPAFEDRSARHAAYAADRYEAGLAEYPGSDLVSRGFLMPVLVGQFDPAHPRLTFEQPADSWRLELETVGFVDVAVTPLVDYWWAPAVVLDARTG